MRVMLSRNLLLTLWKKMSKTQGSRTYNQVERHHLLGIVAEKLPLQKADWDDLATLYNRNKGGFRMGRSAPSLKRKFMCLRSRLKNHKDGSIGAFENIALELKRKIS
ncbi:hypothetical protein PHYPSEUDO_014146 [Phytophthora pseudosyringae]|uniref:DUF6818 domain-containing protein n=1 Tax=Phytophthora pseudosyringae TaxID=221518 RepID=A0A8T1V4H4_9STRA|nr:hypothetical protein PHYPSEUDO_014146 [Phytophthora pseudosyringae]